MQVKYDNTDNDLLFRQDSRFQKLKGKNDHVSINVIRSDKTIILRGYKDDVLLVANELKDLLFGGNETYVEKIFVPMTVLEAIIDLWSQEDRISIIDSSLVDVSLNIQCHIVTLRGDETHVLFIRSILMRDIVQVVVKKRCLINEKTYKFLSDNNNLPVSYTHLTLPTILLV